MFISYIWPASNGVPGFVSSLPDEIIATFGRGYTSIDSFPSEANSPIEAGVNFVPIFNMVVPGCISSPALRIAVPLSGDLYMRIFSVSLILLFFVRNKLNPQYL